MRPLEPGKQFSVELTVTQEMTAILDEQIHNLYSTFSLTRDAERASRRAIVDYLESDEDAIGYEIYLKHFAPTHVGEKVTVTATLMRIEENKVLCALEAFNEKGKFAEGWNSQVVLPKKIFQEKI